MTAEGPWGVAGRGDEGRRAPLGCMSFCTTIEARKAICMSFCTTNGPAPPGRTQTGRHEWKGVAGDGRAPITIFPT